PPPCAYLTVQGYRNGPTTIRRTVRHHPIKFSSVDVYVYIKVVSTGNVASDWWSIAEFTIYNGHVPC
ncbi:hypothetical protein, partial [Streptomyces sp. NPDC018711]